MTRAVSRRGHVSPLLNCEHVELYRLSERVTLRPGDRVRVVRAPRACGYGNEQAFRGTYQYARVDSAGTTLTVVSDRGGIRAVDPGRVRRIRT